MDSRYLFRGMDCNGNWIIGSLIQQAFDGIYTHDYGIAPFGCYPIGVDPATVCQCTGLRDKNGVLIFECDVLKDSRLHGKNCTVVYDNNLCRFICESICPGDTLGLTVYRCNELEIVSNIHEVKND